MAQQMVNGSKYDGSVTITNRMSKRYAVVGEPWNGKHCNINKRKQKESDSQLREKLKKARIVK